MTAENTIKELARMRQMLTLTGGEDNAIVNAIEYIQLANDIKRFITKNGDTFEDKGNLYVKGYNDAVEAVEYIFRRHFRSDGWNR